jgi:hypothetical protein
MNKRLFGLAVFLVLVLSFIAQRTVLTISEIDSFATATELGAMKGRVLGITTVTLQEGLNNYVGTEDKGVHSSFTGTAETISIGGPTAWPAAFRFNLSGIQTDAVVTSAVLSLYYSQDYPNETGSNNKPVSVYKLLKPWVESQATQTNYATNLVWTLAYG